jgi:hypothetical protein
MQGCFAALSMTGSNSFTRPQLAFKFPPLNAQVNHTRPQPKRGQSLIKSSTPLAACAIELFPGIPGSRCVHPSSVRIVKDIMLVASRVAPVPLGATEPCLVRVWRFRKAMLLKYLLQAKSSSFVCSAIACLRLVALLAREKMSRKHPPNLLRARTGPIVKILLRILSSILNHCAFCQGIASRRPISHSHHTRCQAVFLAWRQRFDA